MAITYPLTQPSTPKPISVILSPGTINGVTESIYTAEQQVQEYEGEFWMMEMTFPRMRRAEFAPWGAFFTKLKGRKGTFYAGDPAGTSPLGVATGTPLVNGAGQSGESLITDGWTFSTTGILLQGSYIELGAGILKTLHMVMNDVDSDGSGNATLEIWPGIKTANIPADNAAINLTNCQGVWRLMENINTWDISAPFDYNFSVKAIQAQ